MLNHSEHIDTHAPLRYVQVQAEQVRLLFRQIPTATIASFIAIFLITLIFAQETGNFVLYITSALLTFSSVISLWLAKSFKKITPSDTETIKWAWYFTANTAFTAILWSFFLYWVFDPNSPQYAFLIMFICAGFMIGSAPVLSSFLPNYFIYATTLSTPLIILWLASGNQPYQVVGVLMLVELMLILTFSYWLNRTWKSSIKLKFENLDLVKSLEVQRNAADKANVAKSKFLAAASHDLRQPLHALSLFTAVLDESIKNPKTRRIIKQVNMSVKALECLFNALLDISKLDAGTIKAEKTNLQLNNLFLKLANDYELHAQQKGLHILWQSCPYTVWSDENLLEQILRNFISNAIRYTAQGKISIHCHADTKMVKINVSDTGIGIPEHEQQTVFDEFYQLDNAERDRNKGLGLGLSIVKRTAKLLEHTIEIQSKLGEGSTFSISVERAVTNTDLHTPPPLDQVECKQITKPLIIVIDDEATVREGTQHLLELWGCDVVTAIDKKEALARLKKKNKIPDGIIVDYRLREQETGIQAIHMIHAEYNRTMPALIITGDIAVERLQEVTNSGFQVLHKPVAALKLRTFIHNIQKYREKAVN